MLTTSRLLFYLAECLLIIQGISEEENLLLAPTFSKDFVPLKVTLRQSGEARARFEPQAGSNFDSSLKVSCRFVYYADRSPSLSDEEEGEEDIVNDEATTGATSSLDLKKSAVSDNSHPAVDLLASLKGQCVDGNNMGGFDYAVCVGSHFRQRPSLTVKGGILDLDLGQFDEQDKDKRMKRSAQQKDVSPSTTDVLLSAWNGPQTQLFTRGRFCEKSERKSIGTFFCGGTFALVWVAEVESCVYTFAVTHPSLCSDATLFPVWNAESEKAFSLLARNKGISTASSSKKDSKMNPDERADTLLNALPPVARLRLSRKRQEIARLLRDEESLREANAASRVDTEDVAGVGGGSIGRDDHERHGSKWTGLDKALQSASADEDSFVYSASWALDVHPTWPIENTPKDPSRSSWTCIALGTDDLRRGGGGSGSGNGGARANSPPLPSKRVALNLVVEGVAPGKNSAVVSAVARGSNRQLIPNEIVHREESEKGKHSVILTLQTSDDSIESLDVAFISVTLDVAVDETE